MRLNGSTSGLNTLTYWSVPSGPVLSSGSIEVWRSAAKPPLPRTGSLGFGGRLSSDGLTRVLSPAEIALGLAPGAALPIVGCGLSPVSAGRSSWSVGRVRVVCATTRPVAAPATTRTARVGPRRMDVDDDTGCVER